MKRYLFAVAASLTIFGSTSSPAMAEHVHRIETPGACVDRSGQGWGANEPHDLGSFHVRFHTGRVGGHAFAQDHNPVAIVGGGLCS